ncbi:amidohydrolase family protein [Caproiciproducens sp.]
MIFDAHNHIGQKKGMSFPVEELISRMDKAGVDKAVVFSFPEQIDNAYVAESVRRYPDRLVGFATVNPWSLDTETELKRAVEDYGMVGLKLHPVRHGYAADNHTVLDPVLALCEEYKLPVLAYGGADTLSAPNMYEEMALTFPNVDILLAHGGQMYETKSAIGVVKRQPNLYIECSRMFANRVESLVKENLLDKLIFGTDSPYGDFELEMDKVRIVVENEADREKVFSRNLQKLLAKGGHAV